MSKKFKQEGWRGRAKQTNLGGETLEKLYEEQTKRVQPQVNPNSAVSSEAPKQEVLKEEQGEGPPPKLQKKKTLHQPPSKRTLKEVQQDTHNLEEKSINLEKERHAADALTQQADSNNNTEEKNKQKKEQERLRTQLHSPQPK